MRHRQMENTMRLRRSPTSAHDEQHTFDAVLKNMHLIAVMLDRNTVLTYCNDHFLRLTGWRSEEILNRNWFEIFVPPEEQELKGVFAALIEGCSSAWYLKSHECRFLIFECHSARCANDLRGKAACFAYRPMKSAGKNNQPEPIRQNPVQPANRANCVATIP